MKYFDGICFRNNQNKEETWYPVSEEYMMSLHKQVNDYPSDEDIARIVPDENGKPIFKVLDLDMGPIYRKQRERECFTVINRGNAWYNSLTDDQKQELQTWYQQWLDVTVSLKVPVKPTWLK